MRQHRFLLLVVLLFLFLLDRLIKNIVFHNPSQPDGLFFYFRPFLNNQGPFSLPLPNIILLIVIIVALIWLTRLSWQAWLKHELLIFIASGVMLIGGYSNLWDRLIRGGVVDVWYMALGSRGLNFNLADIYLLVGLTLLIVIFQKRRRDFSI